MAFELAGVDHTHRDKDDIFIVIREQPLEVQQRMHRNTVELAHDNRGGGRLHVPHWRWSFQIRLEGNSQKRVVEGLKSALNLLVMPTHRLANQNKNQGYD